MATMATAMVTSLSFSSCLSSGTLMEPARPMTAAAPQMPGATGGQDGEHRVDTEFEGDGISTR